MMVRKAAMVK